MRKFLIFPLACLLLLAACGSSGPDPAENPEAALTSAFENAAEREGNTFVFTIESDADSLMAASEGELEPDVADSILASSLSMSTTNVEDPEDAEFEMTVDIDGNLVELASTDPNTLYVRADVRELVEQFGGTQAEIDQALSGAPPGFSFVQALVDGEWVEFTGAEALSEQLGAPSPDPEEAALFLQEISAALESAEVTDEGAEDPGQHLVATIGVRELYEAFTRAASNLAQFPGAALPPASEVPSEEIRVDFWVDDDQLTQVQLDVTQFADWEDAEFPEGVDELALQITLEEFGGGVEEPDAADTVDLKQLMQLFMQGMTGSMGTGSTGNSGAPVGDLCESLKGAPAEVIEQFAAECPELQQ